MTTTRRRGEEASYAWNDLILRGAHSFERVLCIAIGGSLAKGGLVGLLRIAVPGRLPDGRGEIIADVTSEREWARSSRRAYIRSHHPDRGGDPTAFRAGLQTWDDVLHEPRPRVVIVKAQPWPRVLLGTLARPIRRRRRRTPRVR
jgi:hypothetical protein